MKFRLHPILAAGIFISHRDGDFSVYTIIFISLLIHEAGHLIAA